MATALVTGANRGIGLALTRALCRRGDQVIAACRSSSPELDALGVRVETGVDSRDRAALARLRKHIGETRIDLLILNAGVLSKEQLGALDEEAFDRIRLQFEINTLGTLRCVEQLQDCLGSGSKLALITSRMGSVADNTSGGAYGYRMSKAALNAAGKSLAHDLQPRGIGVYLLHPGFVQTDMTGSRGDVSADQAAANLIARLDGLSLQDSGCFLHANGEALPW
jgi:NAD(P)-dependent dehydrogenase (short-subunit alcohol dehydrogenase family)